MLRTEKVMIRAMCDIELIEKKSVQERMDFQESLEETLNRPVKTNGVRWYGYAVRDDVLRKASDFEMVRRQGCG